MMQAASVLGLLKARYLQWDKKKKSLAKKEVQLKTKKK